MNALKLGALVLGIVLPSAALADVDVAARVAARSHYFGVENVNQWNGEIDRDKVIISWFSVSSYAVAAKGRVFLLDSYIYRLSDTPGYVPTTLQELVDLDPEAIFIGHGHGDHANNAAYIAVQTGARIFGAAEHCDAMRGDA
jgi:glyoxylase-like metal-dependent hydrolase (beta-lactamase superfamily II)